MSQASPTTGVQSSSLGDLAGVSFVRPWHIVLTAAGCIALSVTLFAWVDKRVANQETIIENDSKKRTKLGQQIEDGRTQT